MGIENLIMLDLLSVDADPVAEGSMLFGRKAIQLLANISITFIKHRR